MTGLWRISSGSIRNETDENRIGRLTTRDIGRSVEAYVARAKSAFYANTTSVKPFTTIEAFDEASIIRPDANRYWLDRLNRIAQEDFVDIFSQIPDDKISEPAKDFALKMLELNTKRLLKNGI